MGRPYFIRGRECKGCKHYDYTTPSKRVRDIDATGYCSACRWEARQPETPAERQPVAEGQLPLL